MATLKTSISGKISKSWRVANVLQGVCNEFLLLYDVHGP